MSQRIERPRKLDTSFVLSSTGDAALRFTTQDIRELLDDPNPSVQVAEGGQVLLVHSLRHQIEFSLQPGRIQTRDRSDDEPFKEGYPQLLERVIAWLDSAGVTFKAYGWNFEAACAAQDDSKAGLVLQGLLRPDVLQGSGLQTIGAAVTLFYRADAAKVRLSLEPRFQDPDTNEVFASVNYHHDGQPASGLDALREQGQRLWQQFIETCSGLLRAT